MGVLKIIAYVFLAFLLLFLFVKYPTAAIILGIVYLACYAIATLVKMSEPKPRPFGRFR